MRGLARPHDRPITPPLPLIHYELRGVTWGSLLGRFWAVFGPFSGFVPPKALHAAPHAPYRMTVCTLMYGYAHSVDRVHPSVDRVHPWVDRVHLWGTCPGFGAVLGVFSSLNWVLV